MNYFWRRLGYAITATSEKIDKTKKKKKKTKTAVSYKLPVRYLSW